MTTTPSPKESTTMATTVDPAVLVERPAQDPFGVGPTFEAIVRTDVLSFHGNVAVAAGRYQARQSDGSAEGVISVWSPAHYAASDRGGMWVSLSAQDWTFPGEPSRPTPEHECVDHLRSGVAGGVFCGVCREEVAV